MEGNGEYRRVYHGEGDWHSLPSPLPIHFKTENRVCHLCPEGHYKGEYSVLHLSQWHCVVLSTGNVPFECVTRLVHWEHFHHSLLADRCRRLLVSIHEEEHWWIQGLAEQSSKHACHASLRLSQPHSFGSLFCRRIVWWTVLFYERRWGLGGKPCLEARMIWWSVCEMVSWKPSAIPITSLSLPWLMTRLWQTSPHGLQPRNECRMWPCTSTWSLMEYSDDLLLIHYSTPISMTMRVISRTSTVAWLQWIVIVKRKNDK